MSRITCKDVERAAKICGLNICATSPGDGMTRYTIGRSGANGGLWDIYHALGSSEAMAFLRGFQEGQTRK